MLSRLETNSDSNCNKTHVRYKQRRTLETYRSQDDVFVWVRSTISTVWNDASVSESELQPTEQIVWCAAQLAKSSNACTGVHLRRLRYPIRFSTTVHYCVLIALAFGRGAVAKPFRGFPLKYRPLIALAFERGAVAKLSRHDQIHRLIDKWLGRVDSRCVSPSWVSPVLRHPQVHDIKD